MAPGLTVRLAEVEFTGRRFRWEPGVYVKTFDGVDSGGETTFDSVYRGVGVLDLPNRRQAPRLITVVGFIYERSEWAMQKRIDQLSALLSEDDSTATLVWEMRGETRQAVVRRHAWAPPRRRAGEASFSDYSLTFRASDQRIFGPLETSPWGAAVTVVHRGGYPAPVVVEVRGDSPGGYTITGPRARIARVTLPIVPGQSHTYDADTGVLRVGGAPQTQGVVRSDQIEIPYGMHQFQVDSGCELRVRFAPTWAP